MSVLDDAPTAVDVRRDYELAKLRVDELRTGLRLADGHARASFARLLQAAVCRRNRLGEQLTRGTS